jgi:activator of HSP90 ATPase
MEFETGTIRQKVVLKANPEEIYDIFIDPRKHSAFTGAKATCNPKVGGRITAWDGYIAGKNVELEKGKRIVQEWKTTEWPRGYPSSILTLTFQRKGNGTLLTMVHSKVPKSQIEEYRQGWYDSYWNPLKEYLAGAER